MECYLSKNRFLRRPQIWAFVTAIFALIIYCLTTARTVTGEDAGELIGAAYTLGICHQPGYPLWCILGKLFTVIVPFGEIAFRVALMSAVFGALTVYFLILLTHRLTGNIVASVAAGLLLAFSQMFWSQCVIAEVYTLNAFFFVLCLYVLVLWDENRSVGLLRLLAILLGLSVTNHHTMVPLGFIMVVYVFIREPGLFRKPLTILSLFGLLLLPLLLYVYIPIRAAAGPAVNWGKPDSLGVAFDHVRRKQYEGLITRHPRAFSLFIQQTGVYGKFYLRQFTYWLTWLPIIGIAAIVVLRQWKILILTFTLFLTGTAGFILFTNFQMETEQYVAFFFLFIPSTVIAAIWAGYGIHGDSVTPAENS